MGKALREVGPAAGSTLLRLAPAATLGLLIAPIGLGLAWTALPAFGWLPAIGGDALSFDGWRALFAAPGFATTLRLTVFTGLTATALALLLAIGFCALRAGRPRLRWTERWLAPLLASPHSAMAIGLAFLIAPSGWLVRLLALFVPGLERPPAGIVTVHDADGIAFIAGLLLKEVPYLVLMVFAASAQVPVARTLATARALGQTPMVAWLKTVLPQIYPQIRLPIYAVLAFSLSAVDVGLILGPGNPPTLAVLATRWFSGYELSLYFPAAAAALLQFLIIVGAIAAWRLAEMAVAALGRRWLECGGRDRGVSFALGGLSTLSLALGGTGLLALLGMGVWSVARSWWYPAALPQSLQLANWTSQADRVVATGGATLAIGLAAVAVALVLSLICLENEQRRGIRPGRNALWLLYLPLLVPQIGFFFGVQLVLIQLDLDGTLVAVIWAHLIFVLPYVFLSLADSFRSLDPRFVASAAALGASPLRIFLAIKLPLLARPILAALAVGFAVSVAQYLPTLFAGAGRIATLTTEAVTLSGSADRRVIGVVAVLQSTLPLLVYGIALAVPALLFANRREMAR